MHKTRGFYFDEFTRAKSATRAQQSWSRKGAVHLSACTARVTAVALRVTTLGPEALGSVTGFARGLSAQANQQTLSISPPKLSMSFPSLIRNHRVFSPPAFPPKRFSKRKSQDLDLSPHITAIKKHLLSNTREPRARSDRRAHQPRRRRWFGRRPPTPRP